MLINFLICQPAAGLNAPRGGADNPQAPASTLAAQIESAYNVHFLRPGEGYDQVQRRAALPFTSEEVREIETALMWTAMIFGRETVKAVGFKFVKVGDPRVPACTLRQEVIRQPHQQRVEGKMRTKVFRAATFGRLIELRKNDPQLCFPDLEDHYFNSCSFTLSTILHEIGHVLDSIIREVPFCVDPPFAEENADFIANIILAGPAHTEAASERYHNTKQGDEFSSVETLRRRVREKLKHGR